MPSALLRHYVDTFARKIGSAKRLSQAAIDALMAYTYPGNVRELMNICEQVVVMSEMEIIDRQDLPRDVIAQTMESGRGLGGVAPSDDPGSGDRQR